MKTSDLTGAALNWAVARADGYDYGWLIRQLANPNVETRAIPHFDEDGAESVLIMERERISVFQSDAGHWSAQYPGWLSDPDRKHPFINGPTLLIAAMRCFVASKFGDEIDLPKELL